jgi:hypothetical protein
MTTPIYDLDLLDYGTTGWDVLLNADLQKIETFLTARRLVTLGETIAAYTPVYMASSGKVLKAQAASTTFPAVGITLDAGVLDDAVRMQRQGLVTNAAWTWTVGGRVYLSTSVAGGLTQTKPANNEQVVGIAGPLTTQIYLEGNILVLNPT